jgi:hypothetical protein
MEENVSGCYALKSLKAIDRIIKVSSSEKNIIADFFLIAEQHLFQVKKIKEYVIL